MSKPVFFEYGCPSTKTLILDAIRESKGTAIAVDDGELLHHMKQTASLEGMLLCPEGAATVAAAAKLAQSGFIASSDTVVLFNTGSAYKYIEVLKKLQAG